LRLKLEKYDYDIITSQEQKNTNADALSRINMTEVKSITEISSVPTEEEKGKIIQEFHQ